VPVALEQPPGEPCGRSPPRARVSRLFGPLWTGRSFRPARSMVRIPVSPEAYSFSKPSRKGQKRLRQRPTDKQEETPFVPGEAAHVWVERSRGAVPMVCTRSLPVAVVTAARNVGAHRVTGEKPDNQAETGCAEGKRDLLVCHGDPRSLRGFDERRLPLTQISSLSRRHYCGTAERADLAPGSLRVSLSPVGSRSRPDHLAIRGPRPRVRRAPGVGWC
jgi:hypothetical protein